MICFLDMDGVLADFNAGAHRVHGRTDAYAAHDPKALGTFEIEKIWHITADQFWEPIRADHNFWYTLDEMPEAQGIVAAATDAFGITNCCILTSPDFGDPHSVVGKHYWIEHHFPQFSKQILFGSAKQFLAGPGRVLVDDRDKNIDAFQRAGGIGIRVPRLWNIEWPEASHTLDIVKERICDVSRV